MNGDNDDHTPLYLPNGTPSGFSLGKVIHTPVPDPNQPFVEHDVFPNTLAELHLTIPDLGPVVVFAQGPTSVDVTFDGPNEGDASDENDNEGHPTSNGLDEVQTEIISMSLTGSHGQLGPVIVRLNPNQPSLGQIEEKVNDTVGRLDVEPFEPGSADSFFDVFFEIELPSVQGGLTLHNNDPLRIGGTITHKPPAPGEMLMNGDNDQIELFDQFGNQTNVFIGKVIHIPVPPEPEPDVDYGDAPDIGTGTGVGDYNTLSTDNGPSHLAIGPMLGSVRDAEFEAHQSADALGDDNMPAGGPDDEDGVTFGGPFVQGGAVDVTFVINGIGASAPFVDAWIDFNRDGVFDGSELILDGATTGGDGIPETVAITVPASAVPGMTYARFRVSTSPSPLLPTGHTDDGEVEDYKIIIEEPPTTGSIHGWKWNDLNGNGVWDAGEPGLLGVDIVAMQDGQVVGSAVTMADDTGTTGDDETGMYRIESLEPGDYVVKEQVDQSQWMQTYPVTWQADLSHDSTFNNSTQTGATGSARFIRKADGSIEFWLFWDSLSGPPTMAHIHSTADGTTGGGVIQDLLGIATQINADSAHGTFTLDSSDLIDDMNNGKAYVNIHTSTNGGGEVAGLIVSDGSHHVTVVAGEEATGIDFGNKPVGPAEEWDFGDLPDDPGSTPITGPGNYRTLLVNDGARHKKVDDNVILGDAWDKDADGQPTANADGDDTDASGDDEDGVTFTTALVAGKTASVDVTATGSASIGHLDAWVDFNGDGDFDDTIDGIDEHVFFAFTVIPDGSTQPFTFDIPASAKVGITYARFRVRTDTDVMGWFGPWPNGEVEDYKVNIEEAPPTTGSIHGYKWEDKNGNRIKETDEPFLPGWTIELVDNGTSQVVATATTMTDDTGTAEDETGRYWFMDVSPGNYLVREVMQTGWERIVPTPAVSGYAVNVIAGQEFKDNHFGNQHTAEPTAFDFGDAPDSSGSNGFKNYSTLLANEGARHATVGPLLGDARDADSDGQPNDLARGDDQDGVVFGAAPLTQGKTESVTVTVTGEDGYVTAWIDFNGNGVWEDSEKIIDNEHFLSIQTSRNFSFVVPADAFADDIYARFRVKREDGTILPTGAWDNGEVEDYRLIVVSDNTG